MLVVANTGQQPFSGSVILDRDLHAGASPLTIAYSNLGSRGRGRRPPHRERARFHRDGQVSAGPAAAAAVALRPREVQVLVP